MNSVVTVSAVIPCYNGAKYLHQTLRSVLDQSRPVAEVIVVDDGSTDDSASIAESFGPATRVIRQVNQGESVARNRGIDEANGDWIALLDADDVWTAGKNERQIAAIQAAAPDVVCCYTDAYRFRGSEHLGVVEREEVHRLPDAAIRLLFDWCLMPSSALIRADVARRVRFPEEVRRGEDVLFFSQLVREGRFLRVPEPLTGYRVSAAQQSGIQRHGLESLIVKDEWFERNRDRFTPSEVRQFKERLRAELVSCHSWAYWSRHLDIARDCRAAYGHRFGTDALPVLMRRPLFPVWLYRLRDLVSRPPVTTNTAIR